MVWFSYVCAAYSAHLVLVMLICFSQIKLILDDNEFEHCSFSNL